MSIEKTFTLKQVKKLIITSISITSLITWVIVSYAIPKIEDNSNFDKMQSNTKEAIGGGLTIEDRIFSKTK